MKIVVAIDSFKGSLSSVEAGLAVSRAAKRVCDDAEVAVSPLADGGEGTVDALILGLGGEKISVEVTGPLGDKVVAEYGILPDRVTAVMEMAAAAGITLVPSSLRNPLNTTTRGVGEMIADAISKGCRRFIIGIGGSATNDGGIGMLSALGFSFLDENQKEVSHFGRDLEKLCKIDASKALPILSECSFRIACDVENTLCGEDGCSAVYGPQKGADEETVRKMDGWLANYARLSAEVSPMADPDFKGTGAAGGLGFAFRSFLNGELVSGVRLIIEETALESKIINADLVITGEGRLDSQTVMGKAPIGVARLAKKHGKKVIAFSGCVGDYAEAVNEHGIDAFFPIIRKMVTLEEALDKENAKNNLEATAYQVLRLINMW